MSKPKKKYLLNFRAPNNEKEVFEKKAKKFTRGNVSEWLRLAGTQYIPPKEQTAKAG